MNRRQIINKILHNHIDVNKYEDYTNYKKLITAIEEWHESEVKKLPIHNVVGQSEQLKALEDLKDFAYENCQPHNSDRLSEIMERL